MPRPPACEPVFRRLRAFRRSLVRTRLQLAWKRRRQALIAEHSPLTHWMAQRLRLHPVVRRLGVEEAASIGMLALVNAVDLFDPTRRVKFSSYASIAIHRKIVSAGRQESLLIAIPAYLWGHESRRSRKPDCKRAALQALKCRNLPTDPEIAHRVLTSLMAKPPAGNADEEAVAWLLGAMQRLTEQQREVLRLRLWEGKTLTEVGDVYGVTRERVRQVQAQAIGLLRFWGRGRRA